MKLGKKLKYPIHYDILPDLAAKKVIDDDLWNEIWDTIAFEALENVLHESFREAIKLQFEDYVLIC